MENNKKISHNIELAQKLLILSEELAKFSRKNGFSEMFSQYSPHVFYFYPLVLKYKKEDKHTMTLSTNNKKETIKAESMQILKYKVNKVIQYRINRSLCRELGVSLKMTKKQQVEFFNK